MPSSWTSIGTSAPSRSKITGNQEFADAEARRVANTLEAFGSKFNNKMNAVRKDVEGQINAHKAEAEDNRSKMFSRLDHLHKMIEKEREDRIQQASEVFGALKTHLKCKVGKLLRNQ